MRFALNDFTNLWWHSSFRATFFTFGGLMPVFLIISTTFSSTNDMQPSNVDRTILWYSFEGTSFHPNMKINSLNETVQTKWWKLMLYESLLSVWSGEISNILCALWHICTLFGSRAPRGGGVGKLILKR